MKEHHFLSSYASRCHFCRKKGGHQPGGGQVILARKKVAGKEVQVCRSCVISKRTLIK